MKKTLIVFILILFWNLLSAVQLKKIDSVILAGGGEDDFIKVPGDLAVTEDGFYIITDRKEGDLKVFDIKGKFIRHIGRKGAGPNEFIQPGRCDYYNRHFVVEDLDKHQFMLMARDKDMFLKETKIYRSIYMGSDIAMMNGNMALIEGNKTDNNKKDWEGYTFDFQTTQTNLLLPSITKYGVSSTNEIEELVNIGITGFCDWYGEYAYFAWLGDLKVFKINMKTRQIKTFGKKTGNYRQPAVTRELKKGRDSMNWDQLRKEYAKISFITGLQTNKNYLILTYDKILVNGEKEQARMAQFYTLDGTFINEMVINPDGGGGIFLSKDLNNDILYMLHRAPSKEENEDDTYQVTRFQILK